MKRIISKEKISTYIITCIITAIIYMVNMGIILNIQAYATVNNYNNLLFIFSWFGVLLSLYCIYTWYNITKTIFCPYIIFLLFFIFFNFGQCLMWSIGIHSMKELGSVPMYDVLPAPNEIEILKTQLYTLVCIICFHCGAIFCYKTNKVRTMSQTKIKVTYKIIFWISILIAIISVPVTLYRAFSFLQVSLQYGYGALYYSDKISQDGITMIIEIFFFPSLAGLLIGSKYNKKIMYIVYLIFSIYFILNLLSGDRGSWLYKIIPLIWLSHIFYKKINFKKSLKVLLLSLIGLYIVYVLVEFRHIGFANVNKYEFIEAFSLKNSPIIEALFEMGGTMGILTILLNVGNGIWIYPNSFIISIISMPSTRIAKSLGYEIIQIENWFSQEYIGINWGAGFSMIGEVFLNYGFYLTPIVVMIIGYFLGCILYTDKDQQFKNYPLKLFFIVTSLSSLAGWARGSSLMFLRNWFRGTLVICILIIIIRGVLIKRVYK